MNLISRLRQWRQDRSAAAEPIVDGDVAAWLLSLSTHLGVLVILTLLVVAGPEREESMALVTTPVLPDDPLAVTEEFNYAETEGDAIGSPVGDSPGDELLNVAPVLDVSPSVAASRGRPGPAAHRRANSTAGRNSSGHRSALRGHPMIKGVAGAGVSRRRGRDRPHHAGDSAVARRSVGRWWCGSSISRAAWSGSGPKSSKRFDRIYEELGVIEASRQSRPSRSTTDKPLLTSVVAFGENVSFLTPKPTDDVDEITGGGHAPSRPTTAASSGRFRRCTRRPNDFARFAPRSRGAT